jgi:hypothetical protein
MMLPSFVGVDEFAQDAGRECAGRRLSLQVNVPRMWQARMRIEKKTGS